MISIRHQLKKYRISWRKTRRQIIFARAWSLTSSTLRSTSAKFPWSSIRLCTEIMNSEVTRISQSIHVGVLSSTVPPVSRHFSGLYLEWEENPVTDRSRPSDLFHIATRALPRKMCHFEVSKTCGIWQQIGYMKQYADWCVVLSSGAAQSDPKGNKFVFAAASQSEFRSHVCCKQVN